MELNQCFYEIILATVGGNGLFEVGALIWKKKTKLKATSVVMGKNNI